MPNLSPSDVRAKYSLYDNKAHSGSEAAESLEILKGLVGGAGYRVVVDRGDAI
jgi:biotin synthase